MYIIVDTSKHGNDHDVARLVTLPFVPTGLLTSIWQLKSGQSTKAPAGTSSWKQFEIMSNDVFANLDSQFLHTNSIVNSNPKFVMTPCTSVKLLLFLKTALLSVTPMFFPPRKVMTLSMKTLQVESLTWQELAKFVDELAACAMEDVALSAWPGDVSKLRHEHLGCRHFRVLQK